MFPFSVDLVVYIQPLIQLFTVLGASGGAFTVVRAVLDYRAGVGARESDADERFYKRLEERLAKTEAKLELLLSRHCFLKKLVLDYMIL